MARAATVKRVTKGERTRQRIVERAAELFNTRGVAGSSMADVSQATGLEKGGIYNHFETKDALALAAFDYAVALVSRRIDEAIAGAATHTGGLRAMIDVYRTLGENRFIPGGCPLMNTAIEADDTNPALRERARKAMDRWRSRIARTVEEAIAAGEMNPVDPAAVASTMIAQLEGAVMLSMLYRSGAHMRYATDHLAGYLDGLCVQPAARPA
jgi:AcrR family transcriptional regulator